jgi:hypothetical protein
MTPSLQCTIVEVNAAAIHRRERVRIVGWPVSSLRFKGMTLFTLGIVLAPAAQRAQASLSSPSWCRQVR